MISNGITEGGKGNLRDRFIGKSKTLCVGGVTVSVGGFNGSKTKPEPRSDFAKAPSCNTFSVMVRPTKCKGSNAKRFPPLISCNPLLVPLARLTLCSVFIVLTVPAQFPDYSIIHCYKRHILRNQQMEEGGEQLRGPGVSEFDGIAQVRCTKGDNGTHN